ncbi:MAG: alpha/beta hydrolase-fold protein [Ruminococcus sp.]
MKKAVSFALVFVSLFMCLTVAFAGISFSEAVLYLGDADLSGDVNIKDATLIQKHAANISYIADDVLFVADADKDGSVNVKDATAIQKFLTNLPVDFPIGEKIVSDSTLPTETEPNATTVPVTVPTEPEIITAPVTEATEPVSTPTESEEEKMDTNITIYFSNNVSWQTVNAYLYKEGSDTQNAPWPGKAMKLIGTNDYGEQIYSIDVDVSEFNRVVFNNGSSQSMNAALSVASSGFYITTQTPKKSMGIGLYAFDETDYGKIKTVTLDFPACGKTAAYKKPIYIWTPKGYDPSDTSKKYPVIYLLDGQNQFGDDAPYNGGWASDEVITSLMKNGGEGVILVGIDNTKSRDNELTPDLGPVPADQLAMGDFGVRTGDEFADFVANKVVPYINANYNTSTDVSDNYIVGSSSGGLEAFYIGMEYMDKFGGIGAVSPAFLLFEKGTWDGYLGKFDFTNADKLPRIYFYNGGGDSLEKMLLPDAEAMPKWLKSLGYPQDKMTFVYEESFAHNEAAWRCMMPEIVSWLLDL